MKKLQAFAEGRWAALALDLLFILFLFGEVAFAHSAPGQATLLLFAAASLALALMRRRVCVPCWFFFYAAFLAWGAICLSWSIRFSTAFAMLRTACINLVFLAALMQYLVGRDVRRVGKCCLAAIGAFVLYVLLASDPVSAMSRFGWDVGVNPNAAGMMTSIACGFSLFLATAPDGGRRRPWYFIPFALFAAVTLFTGSLKAMLVMGGIAALYLMLRYPKYWWVLPVSAAALFGMLYGLSKSRLMYEVPFFYRGYFHDVVWKRIEGLFLFLEYGDTFTFQTASERGSLLAIGIDAIRARPMTGYGLDCFQHLAGADGVPAGTYSHNNYIELLASGGVPMLLIYYAPLALIFVRAIRRARGRMDVKLCIVLLTAVLVADLAVVSYYDRTLLMIPAMLAAAAWQGKRLRTGGPLSMVEMD